MGPTPDEEALRRRIESLEAQFAESREAEKRLARALGESEEKFRLMSDFTHSWEYWLGPDATLVYTSPSCEEHTGYTQEEFMQRDNLLLEIVHPEDRERVLPHFTGHSGPSGAFSMEFRILDRSGNIRWLSHICQPVFGRNQAFLGRRASNWDITDQKRAELERDGLTENLRRTSTLLNTTLDAIPDVIGLQDGDHRVVRYNKAGYDFLGIEPQEAHGRKCYELIGRAKPFEVCATSQVYRTKKTGRVEKYVPEIDRWLDVRAYPVLDENDDLCQVIEHLRDISKEKKGELRLREAHERLITILNSIDVHIYVADLETLEILFMNRKMIEDFKGDFVGRKCHASFRNEGMPCADCSNSELLRGGETTRGRTWEYRNPLTGRWYIGTNRVIKWVDGRLVRIQIATDITDAKNSEKERIQMERQLQQAQKFKAIGTLAGGVAHDFNNLLMGIQGRAALMAADVGPFQPLREHLDAIEEYIQSAADLTRQLLGFARAGKYEVRPMDINKLVLESAALFGRTRKEICIQTQLGEPSPVVAADRRQIEQVLLNMYLNAWQAMPEGGTLYLETSVAEMDAELCRIYTVAAGRYCKIAVTDTGIGMDEATRQRIFDPFFTTREKGRGTGLGLASAYGILKSHGGMVTVYSEVGRGTTFNIYLPMSDKRVDRESPAEKGLLQGSEAILLVDDERMILDVCQAMLEKLGFRVISAQGGEQAIEALRRQGDRIDLVILDLVMPGMDGGKLFDRIRETWPGLPVMLSSGYSINGQAADIMKRGCNGFIQKPFNITELSRMVRKVLDEARSESR